MVSEIFIQISMIVLLTVVFTSLMRLLKQPLIIGYVITGVLVSSPFFINTLSQYAGISLDIHKSLESLSLFSEIGIAILLFIVGLNLNPKIVKEIGFISIITGVGQVIFTAVIGFFIFKMLGFSSIVSFYVAIAITFSSTIIITKLLSDKGDLDSLYGKIAVGFLIIQDIIAVIISIIISSFTQKTPELIGKTLLSGMGVVIVVFLFGIYILPIITKGITKSQELLLLFSLGWCLALASLFHALNFSLEIGALLAGLTLGNSLFRYEIISKLKPLRDFFIMAFFILLGAQITFESFSQYAIPIIITSVFVLIGNPFIVMVIMGILGYSSRTGFFAGLTVAQISEISLIIISLGVKVGHLPSDILSIVTIIGIITFAGSTYLIMHSNTLYKYLSPVLKIFERKGRKTEQILSYKKQQPYEIILLGYNRIGFSLLDAFKRLKKSYLIVDFNPEVIRKLKEKGVSCVYGDADDSEFLEELQINKAEIIISTIPDMETNTVVLDKVRSANKKSIVILTARQITEALELYKKGTDYVILPHFLGGSYTAALLEHHGTKKNDYHEYKKKHIQSLRERIKEGHEHPRKE